MVKCGVLYTDRVLKCYLDELRFQGINADWIKSHHVTISATAQSSPANMFII
jgi:hypothetical protein